MTWRSRSFSMLAVGVIFCLLCGFAQTADGQVSAQDAYQRMQARIAARKTAATSAALSPAPLPTTAPALSASAAPTTNPTGEASDSALVQARRGFKTVLRSDAENPQDDHGEKPDVPPVKVARLIHFHAPIGLLAAYITPDPHDGKRHPAVLWIHGGFGGLDSSLFKRDEPANNDQTPTAFVDAGFVVMCPSFRGHNNNPGKFEMFYGEVDDAVAAIDELAKASYVDPSRIYVVGHSTGGTMTLLVAEACNKIRAAFSLCGCPDVAEMVAHDEDHHHAPYDYNNPEEGQLRSAVNFVETLKTPLWFFDESDSFYVHQARVMRHRAATTNAPFRAFVINPATHFDVVRPLTQLIAAKLQSDTGSMCDLTLMPDEIAQAFAKVFDGRKEDVEELLPPATIPNIHLTDLAKKVIELGYQQHQLDPAKSVVVVQADGDHYNVVVSDAAPADQQVVTANGVRVTADDRIFRAIGPFTISVELDHHAVKLKLTPGIDAKVDEPPLQPAP